MDDHLVCGGNAEWQVQRVVGCSGLFEASRIKLTRMVSEFRAQCIVDSNRHSTIEGVLFRSGRTDCIATKVVISQEQRISARYPVTMVGYVYSRALAVLRAQPQTVRCEMQVFGAILMAARPGGCAVSSTSVSAPCLHQQKQRP